MQWKTLATIRSEVACRGLPYACSTKEPFAGCEIRQLGIQRQHENLVQCERHARVCRSLKLSARCEIFAPRRNTTREGTVAKTCILFHDVSHASRLSSKDLSGMCSTVAVLIDEAAPEIQVSLQHGSKFQAASSRRAVHVEEIAQRPLGGESTLREFSSCVRDHSRPVEMGSM